MDLYWFPPRLFEERLPATLRERGPRVVDTAAGPTWMVGGVTWGPSGSMPGQDQNIPNVFARAGLQGGAFRPSSPALRLEDMDRDGVHAQVIYGPVRRFEMADRALRLACLRAYNDWAAEFSAHDPNRLCMLAILPADDPADAAVELQRAAGLGHRGAVLPIFESDRPVFGPAWSRLWDAASDTGLPISFHIAGGVHSLRASTGSWELSAYVTVLPAQLDEALAGMIFSGELERHPNVRLVLGESGIGWIPYMIERMDHVFPKYLDSVEDYRLSRAPSAIFRDQVLATFQDDRFGVRAIADIGADNVMWASDYPHPDSTFPNSRRVIEESFRGVDESVTRKVVCDNAARLYRFP
jgi:predicted TIM-barrel fold metal-dependent hydrolase